MTNAGPRFELDIGAKIANTLWTRARHKALYGGRGSAKSWSVATYLAIIAANRRLRIVCARQFQNSIRDSSKELIEKRIRHLGMEDQFDITEQEIVHKTTHSRFTFVGLERNIDSIRSLEGANVVWIDEARTIKQKSMEILLPTIREKDSEIIWTWNPELPEDPVDAYFRSGEPPVNSIVTFVNYVDNPFFWGTAMPAEMETLKRGNLLRYKHVWEGDYDLKHESKVFPNVVIGVPKIMDGIRPRYGMDFGFGKDPSVVTKVYVNEQRRHIYIAAEAFGGVAMDDLPVLVRSVIEDDEDVVVADASQPGPIEFLRRRGLDIRAATKGPGSVKAGINFLLGYTIYIDPSCEGMREEARLYSWMVDIRGKILNTPVDANNHGWDATRYAVEDLSLDGQNNSADDSGVIKLKWR